MDIKEIFDKATSENKSLTYEEFNNIVKAEKAKFTDLSEGRYVDKQKYDDDLATKTTEIETLNETIKNRDADLASLQEQLKTAGTDAGKLEELTTQLTDLQNKYTTETQALNTKLSEQAYEFAVRDFANTQKFSSPAAKKVFIDDMKAKSLPMENGTILGANDWLKVYMKENKESFVQDKPGTQTPPPQFAGSTKPEGGEGGKKMTLSEMMQAKNENPDMAINFD